jgi:hypothetical protein
MRSSRRAVAQLIGRNFETVADIEAALPDGLDSTRGMRENPPAVFFSFSSFSWLTFKTARPFVGALKYLWRSGKRNEAIAGLDDLVRKITSASVSRKSSSSSVAFVASANSGIVSAAVADPRRGFFFFFFLFFYLFI